MKLPTPAVSLPQWRWLKRFDRWRCERGILTGWWTQAEVDDIRRRARLQHANLQKLFD